MKTNLVTKLEEELNTTFKNNDGKELVIEVFETIAARIKKEKFGENELIELSERLWEIADHHGTEQGRTDFSLFMMVRAFQNTNDLALV
ncbi:MAG: hypothetical protein ACK5LV_11225 [Lachnospirales bacterium]